jgi:hypothetical protein
VLVGLATARGRDGDLWYGWGSPAAARTFPTNPGQRAACATLLIGDRAGQFTDSCGAVVTAAGSRIVRSPPRAPRGNAAWAPMTGTVCRGLSGRLLIAGEHHRRRVLAEYLLHDHTSRPHRTLGQVPPAHPHARPPQTGLAEHRVRRKQAHRRPHP